MTSHPIRFLAIGLLFFVPLSPLTAQPAADPAADMLLNNARLTYNQKNYPSAADRFREFIAKYGQHKEVPSARYGLALCLVEGPAKDYTGAVEQLQKLTGNKELADYPFVLYYLGLSQRGLGLRAAAEAAAKPNEPQHKVEAQKRFDEAAKQYAAAQTAFADRVKAVPADAKELPVDLEWAAHARCDLAEMQLRLQKAKEAREAVQPFLEDKTLAKSRYHTLGLYFHGFASYQLKDYPAAARALTQLTPYTDPVFGTHARYLLARIHDQENERQEAVVAYDGVISEYARQKAAAAETLKDPARYNNDPNEKARLEALLRERTPEHVELAAFYLGVMQYEDGKFSDAAAHLALFAKDNPTSPLLPEAQLRIGFCQVQLKQFPEAQRTLAPLIEKQPHLADQCLYWIAKAQAGEAGDPVTNKNYAEKMKTALASYRAAVERTAALVKTDPAAAARRGEILLDLGDALQTMGQYKDAVAAYNQIQTEKLILAREEEVTLHLATALQLNGEYAESDKVCVTFRDKFAKSTLLPVVLFRHAENAYFLALAAEKIQKPADRFPEVNRWNEEALKRYAVVVEKYPEFTYASLARYGLGMAYYRKGDFDKAKEVLMGIPSGDRAGELAIVPYQIADILIRMAPAKIDDAISAGKLEEALKGAIELLDGYVGANPNSPQTADAYLKIGHCYARMAATTVEQAELQKELQSARQAYEQVLNRFQKTEAFPQAVFERAKVIALAKDINGAMNELRRFTNDPLKNARIAPLAQLQLATWYRGQNRPQDAVTLLTQTRQNYEGALQNDPHRAGWIPLLQYHHGVALRETGKTAEARVVFEQVVKQWPDHPEALEAALRSGQCLKDEGQTKVNEGRKRLATPNMKPEDLAAAKKLVEDGSKELRDAAQRLLSNANQWKEKQPDSPTRARMLYEAAWAYRVIAEEEVETVRDKMIEEQWQKLKDEVAKITPMGKKPLFVPKPDVPLSKVAVQPAEKEARVQYQRLIDGFPDLAVNADARFELAELLAERGEYDDAIKLLKQALDKEPPQELTEKVRVRLGGCLLAKGDTKAALAQFNAVTQNPKSHMFAQATYQAGECSMQAGDFAAAEKRFIIFRDQGPYQNLPGLTDRALLRLGHAFEKQKNWEPSRQAHEQVVNRFPQSVWVFDARYGMAWAQQNMNQFDQAIGHYTQVATGIATELGARAQLNIGLCKLAQKKYAEAATALLVVPTTFDYPQVNALALVEAARAFVENKQKEEAIKLLESVLRDYPNTEPAKAAKERLEMLKKS